MDQWKILVSKEIKHVHELLKDQWGFEGKLDYAFLRNSQDNVYIVSKDVAKIDWTKLRITGVGSYFGELKNGLRLSIEGSQLIGPGAQKNVVDINAEETMLWLKGHDIKMFDTVKGYVLVRSGKDFLGTGTIKDNMLLNFVPKIRRLPENA